MTVRYVRNGNPEKSLELTCDCQPLAYLLDSFVLEQVMKEEDPHLRYHPQVPNKDPGEPATLAPSNAELAQINGISKLTYQLDDGRPHGLTT